MSCSFEIGGQQGEAEESGNHVELGRNAFFFFSRYYYLFQAAQLTLLGLLPCPFSSAPPTSCLLCNCRDWMRSMVAWVAQVMEPVGGQRQGREGAKWRGIALCRSNKSLERCLLISHFRLIHSLLLDKMCFFFFYEHTLKLMGKKIVLYIKKKKRYTTLTDWRKLNHGAACVCLFESLEIPSYKLSWQTSLKESSGQSFVFLSALTTWQILLMLHPCNCSSREQGTRCATSGVHGE